MVTSRARAKRIASSTENWRLPVSSRASYALKLLQSEGVLSIASTGKDASTGKLITHEYRVEGPVMIFLTSTAIDIDEELLNRCLVLSVNEDRSQTQAIHRVQREQQTLEGLLRRKQRQQILRLHRNAQRLLQPLTVVNPYAKELTFPDTMMRSRRDQSFVYELVFVPAENHSRPQLPGLIHIYDLKKSGVNGEKSAPGPRQVRGVSGGGPTHETRMNTGPNGVFGTKAEKRISGGL